MMNSTLPRCRALVRFPNEDEKSYTSGPETDGDQWPARTLDISASGLALVTPRPFEPGSVLSVELPVCNSPRPRRVLACVMRVHSLGANEWVLGCQFATELRDQDLQALGARREPTTPPDDRTWVRFPCKIDTRYQSITDDERDSWPAQVSRLTASGADLVLPRSFEPGSLLSVQLTDNSGRFSCDVLACVVYASYESPGDCVVGCTFASELNQKELEALL